MAEYIDRSRLKDAFHTDTEHLQSFDVSLFELLMLEIDEIPAADVVEVVRCIQCKHAIPLQHSDNVMCHGRKMPKDGFCSYGERKYTDESGNDR